MRIKEKEDAIFVKGVVLPCGVPDKTGDAPVSKEDIKKIFTNYLTYETDVQHSWVSNFGVYLLENTLEKSETTIAGQTVPEGSWTASMMIVNPDIRAMIGEGNLNGFSLGAVGETKLNENQDFLNKSLRYEHLKDAEHLNPIFISLVNKPANGYVWEVLTYKQFLAKSLDYGENIMSTNIEQQNKTEEDSSVLVRVIETLTTALSKKDEEALTKSEESKEETEESEEKETLEKEDDIIENDEILRQIPTADEIAEAVVKALKAMAEKEEPLQKSEETSEEKEDPMEKECKTDDEMEKSLDNNENKQERLEKSITSKIPETQMKKPKSTFLNSETRDRFGRNKKYL